RTFHHYNLDFCCGGRKSFREAPPGKGPNPLPIADSPRSRHAAAELRPDSRDEPPAPFVSYILERYPARHREPLPELIRLARRVEQVHGAR
ncbi:iron-sulfur cluster repair di-iron protein, partial [Pseudomonas ogarae]